jgi:hypothetical protein
MVPTLPAALTSKSPAGTSTRHRALGQQRSAELERLGHAVVLVVATCL